MHRANFFTILLISWIVFVTFSSLFSFEGMDTSGIDIPHMDKLVHFTFYFVMAILSVVALKEDLCKGIKLSKALFLGTSFSVLYGIIIEVIQSTWTSDRHGDVWDAIANTMGALAGMVLTAIWISRKGPLKWKF
ncbi:VanZ family protein [Maribacter sp. 2304DJ31-5]|uniref:VanZ family protein n=1 Tax=Maribacter sp. 2304DJ31-5 TaxID=3386273 RepID=UPI0039BC59CA